MKQRQNLSIDSAEAKRITQENIRLSQQFSAQAEALAKLKEDLDKLQEFSKNQLEQNEKLRNLLENEGIKFEGDSLEIKQTNIRSSLVEVMNENEKLKHILELEGIEYNKNTFEYQSNHIYYQYLKALNEIRRTHKLLQLPVVDIWDAIERHSIVYVRYFINEDPNIVFAFKNGYTALHRAIELGDMEMIHFLLNHSANITAKTSNDTTSLMLAARSGNIECFNFVYEKCKEQIENRPDGLTLLHAAVSGGNILIVKYLIGKGFDVNAQTLQGVTPIFCIEDYNPMMFNFLIEQGANVLHRTLSNRSMIHVACRTGSFEFVQAVLSMRVRLDGVTNDGCNALHLAVIGGNLKLIQHLLPHFKIDCRTNAGYTPLLIAVEAEEVEIVRFLLVNGADITCQLRDERSALHLAALAGNTELCEILLTAGIPVDAIDAAGHTPAMLAAASRSSATVALLVARGANPVEEFNDAVKHGDAAKTRSLFDPFEESRRLRTDNEELKRVLKILESKVVVTEKEEEKKKEFGNTGTQTAATAIVTKRFVNQIGIVTIAADDRMARLMRLQDDKKRLENELNEMTEVVSEFNQLKVQLEDREKEYDKAQARIGRRDKTIEKLKGDLSNAQRNIKIGLGAGGLTIALLVAIVVMYVMRLNGE